MIALFARDFTNGSIGRSPGIGGGPSGFASDTTATSTLFAETVAGLLFAFSSAKPAIHAFSSAMSPSESASPFGGIFGSPSGLQTL